MTDEYISALSTEEAARFKTLCHDWNNDLSIAKDRAELDALCKELHQKANPTIRPRVFINEDQSPESIFLNGFRTSIYRLALAYFKNHKVFAPEEIEAWLTDLAQTFFITDYSMLLRPEYYKSYRYDVLCRMIEVKDGDFVHPWPTRSERAENVIVRSGRAQFKNWFSNKNLPFPKTVSVLPLDNDIQVIQALMDVYYRQSMKQGYDPKAKYQSVSALEHKNLQRTGQDEGISAAFMSTEQELTTGTRVFCPIRFFKRANWDNGGMGLVWRRMLDIEDQYKKQHPDYSEHGCDPLDQQGSKSNSRITLSASYPSSALGTNKLIGHWNKKDNPNPSSDMQAVLSPTQLPSYASQTPESILLNKEKAQQSELEITGNTEMRMGGDAHAIAVAETSTEVELNGGQLEASQDTVESDEVSTTRNDEGSIDIFEHGMVHEVGYSSEKRATADGGMINLNTNKSLAMRSNDWVKHPPKHRLLGRIDIEIRDLDYDMKLSKDYIKDLHSAKQYFWQTFGSGGKLANQIIDTIWAAPHKREVLFEEGMTLRDTKVKEWNRVTLFLNQYVAYRHGHAFKEIKTQKDLDRVIEFSMLMNDPHLFHLVTDTDRTVVEVYKNWRKCNMDYFKHLSNKVDWDNADSVKEYRAKKQRDRRFRENLKNLKKRRARGQKLDVVVENKGHRNTRIIKV